MSGDKKVNKRLTYWCATFLREDHTLQSALQQMINALPTVGDRRVALATGDNSQYFINKWQASGGMLVGQFVVYEPGRNHMVLEIDESKPTLDLLDIAPSTKNAKAKAEFLESVLYFAAMDNHLVLLQSRSLGSREFDNYLAQTFIKSATLHADDQMTLLRGLSETAKKKIQQDPPSKLRISTDIFAGAHPVADKKAKGKRPRYQLAGPLWSLLKRLGEKGNLDNLHLDEGLDPSALRVSVEVKYRKRSDTEAGRVMQALTNALRHVHEGDIRATFPKTGEMKGDQIFLSHVVGVLSKNGNVVETDLYRLMREWLQQLLDRAIV